MHIVITRPKEESVNLIDNLIKLGHLVTYLPVIKIEKLETQKINFENYKAVIFTSSNAIKYINIEKLNYKIKDLKQIDFNNILTEETSYKEHNPYLLLPIKI